MRETEQDSDRRQRGHAAAGEQSKTALTERFDNSLGFARINGVGAAKITDALAGHTPREVARTAVSVLNLAISGNAKTFSSALMSFNLRHLRPFVSIKVAQEIETRAKHTPRPIKSALRNDKDETARANTGFDSTKETRIRKGASQKISCLTAISPALVPPSDRPVEREEMHDATGKHGRLGRDEVHRRGDAHRRHQNRDRRA